MNQYVEISQFDGAGYRPMVHFEAWRVALLNYDTVRFAREAVARLERHNLTDEVFVLLSGQCTLIIGGDAPNPVQIETLHMEPGRIYNVKKSVWHALYGSTDMKLLIVENDNTSKENSEYAPLDPAALD